MKQVTGTESYFENFIHIIHGISTKRQRKLMFEHYLKQLAKCLVKIFPKQDNK